MSKSDKRAGIPRPRDIRREEPEDPPRGSPNKGKKKSSYRERNYRHNGDYRWQRKGGYHHGSSVDVRCFCRPVLNKTFDAYYCAINNRWLEQRCNGTENCKVCLGRPSKPLPR